jgi:hypothetical protein
MLERLRRRGEPPSILEHVRAHVRLDVPGLSEGGAQLPDEDAFAEHFDHGQLRWSPGSLEGAFVRYAGSPDDEAAVERLHSALIALADRPSARTRRRVRELFREGDVRVRIDGLNERLHAFLPQHPERLYSEMRELFLTSGHRDEVKYAMAIMSGFGQPEDAELFRLIGRHEEFTLYAAVALANVTDDPQSEWLGLLPHVSGWGRTELSELILQEPQPIEVREELLRDGLGIGNALTLAVSCRLHEFLARDDLDDELLVQAREILDSLTWSFDSPNDLTDYPDAAEAVERLLELLRKRDPDLDDLVTAHEIKRFVTAYGGSGDERVLSEQEADEKLAQAGFDDVRRARIVALCDAVVAREHWRKQIETCLESDDDTQRNRAIEAAKRLDIDLDTYLVAQIRRNPGDSYLWFQLAFGADESRLRNAVELAVSLWDLSEITRGPALDLFAPGDRGPLQSIDYLLQELPRFPGLGGRLLAAALQSPVVRHRLVAVRALSRWPEIPADLRTEIADRHASDPDEGVRDDAGKVLAGEALAEPTVEWDENDSPDAEA